MILCLPVQVPIISNRVIGIISFLGVDPIAAHSIDCETDTPGDLTPSNSELFGGIAETEGVNYLPGLQGDQDL